MLHPLYLPGRPISENTWSVMQTRYCFFSEERLRHYPTVSIFDMKDEQLAEAWWQTSYDAEETPVYNILHTFQQLRALVLSRFPEELYLLSARERRLMIKLLWRDGCLEHFVLPAEIPAIESLVRRMWCTFEVEDDSPRLYLPHELLLLVRNILPSEEYQAFSLNLLVLEAAIRAQLYLRGTLPLSEALSLLNDLVLEPSKHAFNRTLAIRYLKASFHYLYDESGELLLLHPGLIDTAQQFSAQPSLPQDQAQAGIWLGSAAHNLLPEEEELYQRFYKLACRELHNEQACEQLSKDIRLLIKQNIPLSQVTEVLRSRLLLPPSEPLLDCLKQLYQFTPRWKTQTTALWQ